MSLIGCAKEAGYQIYRRSFAMVFHETEKLTMGETNPRYSKPTLLFGFDSAGIIYSNKDTSGKEKELYDALCEKYGDMTYNREEFVPIGFEPEFLAYSPVSITIVSDADYDDQHPAGTSLADIVTYDSQSSKPFIDNGYVMHEWDENDKGKFYYYSNTNVRPFYPVCKKASELVADDFQLIYDPIDNVVGYIYFDALPTLEKTHNITVTFTDERGEVFSDTVKMVFE
jgi:hypothetical protein